MTRNGEADVSGGGGVGGGAQRGGGGGTDVFLVVCGVFRVITAVAAALCVCVDVISAIRSFSHGISVDSLFEGLFRCYAVVFALFVIMIEVEWERIMQYFRVFEYWAPRAVLQIFVAIMTRAFPTIWINRRNLTVLQDIASYLLLACGLTYLLAGLLCLGYLKRAHQKKKVPKAQAEKDLEEIERRREELGALLHPEMA